MNSDFGFHQEASSLLILTVGTGTAGKHSDVAQGLANTIRHVRPRKFWLVPSASEKSTPVADLIRESVADPERFVPWSESAPYRAIPNHDDIHECRRLVREVINAAKRELRPEERLIVNPTSGTKQMSAGATLAALDEEVDQIDFTGGERVDGVVKTGTEVVQSFNLRDFLFQRDLRTADELFRHGAFYAAARLLERYAQPEALRAREKALCLHEWQRMNYAKAASHSAKFSEELRVHLKCLADSAELSVSVLGDLLAGADELARWGDHEEALARYYRSTEYAAKLRLAEAGEPTTELGWKDAWSRLQQLRDPLANEFWANGVLRRQLQARNESIYGHGRGPVDPEQTRVVADGLRSLLRAHLPAALACWTTAQRPRSLV